MLLQLLGLIIIPFTVVLLAVAVGGVGVHQEAMKRLIAERDVRGTRAAAAALGQSVYHLRSSIRLAAERQQAGQPAGQALDVLLNEFDAGYLLIERTRGTLASSVPPPAWQGKLQFDRYPRSESAVSEVLAQDGGTVVLLIAAETDVVVVAGFSIQNLSRTTLLSSMVASDNSSVFVVDRAANLLYYAGQQPTAANLLQHPGVSEGLRGESGSAFQEAEGEERVVAFAAVPNTDWALVVEEPWREVTSPVLDLSLLAPLALAPALVITVLGLWFGARQVIRPLRALQEQAEQIALSADSFEHDSPSGIAEIQQLRQSLARMAARVSSAQNALQRYIGAITTAQEEERGRLARDLHDETIQGLIAIDHRIQMLTMELEHSNADLAEPLQALHGDVSRSITELRRVTKALRPVFLEDLGLVPAIKMLVEEFDQGSKTEFRIHTAGSIRRLDPQVELAVYRIVQEALSNVARHSDADSAEVSIEYAAGGFSLTIRDDGLGFDAPLPSASYAAAGHFGLMSMRERATLIGAALDIDASTGQGTQVQLRLEAEPPASDRQNA